MINYFKKIKIINLVIAFIILVLLAFSGYFYYQLNSIKNNPKDAAQEEIKNLINKVSKLYLIPSDEDPTIATVSDPTVLKDQSFFTLSEKGDKVLIFTKAGKAVLYRPSINKIIEIAPIKNNSISPTSNENQDVTLPKEKTKTN